MTTRLVLMISSAQKVEAAALAAYAYLGARAAQTVIVRNAEIQERTVFTLPYMQLEAFHV